MIWPHMLLYACVCLCSHCQSTGGDQGNAIYLELERMGFKAWYGEWTAEAIHSVQLPIPD